MKISSIVWGLSVSLSESFRYLKGCRRDVIEQTSYITELDEYLYANIDAQRANIQ